MDGKRAPQRTRQLASSRSNDNGLADDRAGRGGRHRDTFGERMRKLTGGMPLMGRITGHGRRQREIDREWDNASLTGSWGAAEPLDDGPLPEMYDGPPGGMGADDADEHGPPPPRVRMVVARLADGDCATATTPSKWSRCWR